MRHLDEIARRQWGLITYEQLLNLVSRNQIHWMQKTGKLIRVHRGLYRMEGAPITWQQNVAAALLVIPEAVASYTTAGRLHDLKFSSDTRVHITVQCSQRSARKAITTHRSDISAEDVVIRQRISCTAVERTIVDLASMLTRRQLAIVIDEAVIAGKTTFMAIAQCTEKCAASGRKGIQNLRALLAERLPLADNFDKAIELKVLKAAKRAGVPQPETQYKVLTKYGPYFIDAAWPNLKIGAEADGYNVHSANRIRHTDDRRRRNELETLKWHIFNFTYDMTVDEVAAVLRANLPLP